MSRKKKKKSNTPRTKRMNKNARLSSASHWLKSFDGKNLLRSYKNRYGVDELCAMLELRLLERPISDDQIQRAKKTIENNATARKKANLKKEPAELNELYSDSDETFAYIAGYTSGGVPYGVTWDETNEKPDDFVDF